MSVQRHHIRQQIRRRRATVLRRACTEQARHCGASFTITQTAFGNHSLAPNATRRCHIRLNFSLVKKGGPSLLALALALTLAFGPKAAHAQGDRMTELEKKLDASAKLIEQLSARLAQLEGKAAAPATAAASPQLTAKVVELEQALQAINNKPEEDRGLALHGFADVGWARSTKGHQNGGFVGALDFYMTPKFGDRVVSLIELNFEVGDDGGVGVDLERLQVGYIVNDSLTLWLGRFHTPYGYWNTAFHHGAQLQTAVMRPRFLDFEDRGGIVPAHSVGAWATGAFKTAVGALGYDVFLSNAPGIVLGDPSTAGTGVLDMRQAGTRDRQLLLGTNLNFSFKGALAGLTLGTHTLMGKVGDDASAGTNLTRFNMTGLWTTYLENNWEVMAELYRFNNRDLSGGTGHHKSTASYAQVGYDFGALTPFVRVEKTALNQADNYFAQQASGQSYKRSALGLRWELNPKTVVKFEADRTTLTDRAKGSFSELRSQLAVRF